MSKEIKQLLKPYNDGVIDGDSLNIAIKELKQPPRQPTQPAVSTQQVGPVEENLRKKRRDKKKRQKQTHAEATAKTLEETHLGEHAEASQNLKLVDKPLCNYFKTYEINVEKYNDPSILLMIKSLSYQPRSAKTYRNTLVSNFRLVYHCNSLKMKKMEQESTSKEKNVESKVLFWMVIM